MKIWIAAVVLATTAGRADAGPTVELSGEVAAGAGADTTSNGQTSASGSLAAGLVGAPPPRVGMRCLGATADDGSGLWFGTNPDPGDRNALRADASALLIATPTGDPLVVDAGASARGCGWQLGGHVAYQPIGGLRDPYWRSGRDVVATTIDVEMPMGFAIKDPNNGMFWFGDVQFDITSRALRGADAGYDVDAHVRFVRWIGAHATVDVGDLHDIEFDGPGHYSASSDTLTRTLANDIAFDAAAFDWHLDGGLELSAHAGFDTLHPMGIYTQVGTMAMPTTGPQATVPRYEVELASHAGRHTLSLGAGSWARLDPTGQAADAGQLATAAADWKLSHLELRSDLQLGRLRRVAIGDMAPNGILPIGSTMVMGRGSVEVDVPMTHRLVLASTAWAERSDRDDPRWVVPASGTLATHAGVDASVKWRFR